ncbi:MAG: hypothetical protein U5R30_21245 [Deltaproteobacteria bacterium]|nr:hypothetical protein [Deltaproteobacteria bacterium]
MYPNLHAEILAAGVFTQADAARFRGSWSTTGTRCAGAIQRNALRVRFPGAFSADRRNARPSFICSARLRQGVSLPDQLLYLFPDAVKEFAAFAEYIGPQLIKQGSVSDLMKQIRQTEVVKAAVRVSGRGPRRRTGEVKLRPGGGGKGQGPPPRKVSVRDMIDGIRATFAISDDEALYIKQVTEEKAADPVIRGTVQAHQNDPLYLEGAYRGQVNGEIQVAYNELARYEELADPKYTGTGGIFDIMAVTVIRTHLMEAA